MTLQGAKVLVAGASAGIGRDVGLAALKAGADVAFAARRLERLEKTVAEAGGGHAIALDVRDEDSVVTAVADAVLRLGGLDVVVYAAGVARLGQLVEHDADQWREMLETNLVGAALVAKAAVPHLEGGRGVMLFCSSTADGQPRWGLSAYGASKAGLNYLIDALRMEHRDARFIRVTIGSTIGTEFGNNFDGETLQQAFAQWLVAAQHTANLLTSTEVADVLVTQLETLLAHPDVDIPRLYVEPPGGPLTLPPTSDVVAKAFEET